jgi:hypothetical protein
MSKPTYKQDNRISKSNDLPQRGEKWGNMFIKSALMGRMI